MSASLKPSCTARCWSIYRLANTFIIRLNVFSMVAQKDQASTGMDYSVAVRLELARS